MGGTTLYDFHSGWWFGTWLDYDFPYIWECHHPNWRTHIFQRGWNHQPVHIYIYIYLYVYVYVILFIYHMLRTVGYILYILYIVKKKRQKGNRKNWSMMMWGCERNSCDVGSPELGTNVTRVRSQFPSQFEQASCPFPIWVLKRRVS